MTAEATREAPDSEQTASTDEARFWDLYEDLRAPISETAPGGERVLYDEAFRSLKTHVDAIGAVTGTADYQKIVTLARSILRAKAKDLRVAGYLVLGEARTRGAEGIAAALRVVQGLLDEYWDELYPEADQLRARGNALQFVADRLPDWLTATSFESDDRAALVAAHDALTEIQSVCLEALGEHAPSLSGLKADLEKELEDLPEPTDPGQEETSSDRSAEEQEPSTDASPDSAPPEKEGPSSVEIESDTEAAQTVRWAARHYREADLTAPLSYRLLRTLRWAGLRSTPPHEQGTTRFEAPRSQRREYLRTLLEEGRHETLVREGESTFQAGDAHVWLDLQRLCAEAFRALGDPFAAARRTVRSSLRDLLRRVPALVSLTFHDGTPLASRQTRDWIETEGLDGDAAPSESPEAPNTPTDPADPVEARYEEAKDQLRRGTLEEALALATDVEAENATEKDTFRRRLSVAKLCVEGGQPAIARPLIDPLADVVENRRLGTWNPDLATAVWRTRRRCYQALAREAPSGEAETYREEAEASFEALCRIDPVSTLRRRSSGMSAGSSPV